MSERFDPRRGLVLLDARLEGSRGIARVRLMLDTGAFLTMLRPGFLERLGYDLGSPRTTVPLAGVTGSARAPLSLVDRLTVLGYDERDFALLGYAFSGALPFDGLLGANFLRGHRLTVDYRGGIVSRA